MEGNPLSHEIQQVIDVLPPRPASTISALPETGINPLTVALSTEFYEGVKYQWQTDGGQLSMANSHVAMIKFEESGTYTITLIVTDTETETDKTEQVSKTITVDAPPPPEPLEAKASVSQTEGIAPLTVMLDASESKGDIDDYVWTSSDKQIAGKRATLILNQVNSHSITLTVSAEDGRNETDTVIVTVKEKPVEAPDAVAMASPLEGIVPLSVTLNANGSKPRDKIKEYGWMSTDGQVASGKLTQMTFDKPDTYTITLRVMTESGLDSTTQVTVVVKEPPPPVADAKASPNEGVVPLNVNFHANKSEGDIEEYEWTINGQTFYGRRTSFLFEEAGEYTITLLVTDKYGHEHTTETKVTVKPKSGPVDEPVAVAKASPADGFAPLNVTLDASDSTGKLTDYTWTTPQGTTLYGKRASLLLLEAANYPITLTVKDQNGLTATASTTVTVKKQPEEHEPPVAVANITPTEGTAPLKLALDGSESQGKIEEYLWISSSGDIAKGKLTNMWIENQGTHVITLRVIGPNGNHETKTTVLVKSKPVTIIDKPTPPTPPSVNVVNEVVTEGEGLTEGKQITLDAGDNPDITEYKWTTTSGDVYYGQKPTISFTEQGEHNVDLTLTDKNGLTTTKENVLDKPITVPPPAAPPPVVPTSLDQEPEVQFLTDSKGQTVKEVKLSVPEVPGVVEYEWKASTGEVAYGRQPSFLFNTPGERTIDLIVKDKNGQTATAEKIATVSGPEVPPLPPIEPEKVEEKVAVSASEEDPNVVELDASQLTEEFGDIDDDDITWQAINEKGEVVVESKGKKSSLSLPSEEGTYTIKMIVKDKAGGIRAESVVDEATVEPSGGVRVREKDVLNAIISDEIKNLDVCKDTTITLDGSRSTGSIEKYEWIIKPPPYSGDLKYLDGPKTQWIAPNQAGPYTITLRVIEKETKLDDDATATVTVVTGGACEIKACFKATLLACENDSEECLELGNQENIMAGSSPDTLTGNMAENWFLIAEVDASCSNRADVSIINYQWELDGMEIPSSKIITIPPDKGFERREHWISLKVTDDQGKTSVPAKQKIMACELIAKATVEPEQFIFRQDYEKPVQVYLDASPSQLVCGSKVSDVSDDFSYNWHLEADSSNKASCQNFTCYIKEQNSKQTTIDTCSGSVPEDTDSCTYIPILELKGPKGVTDESNLADTAKVTVKWPPLIPRIKIEAPNVVKAYTGADGLLELENNVGYYGVAPLTLELKGESESASKADKQYNWTVYYHNFHDSDVRVTDRNFNDKQVINPTFDKPGKYTIELRVIDKMGTTSDPTSITIHVGPMLQFVSGEPSSEDSPGKLVRRKKLGDALNLDLKVNLIPELVPNCAIENEEGEYKDIVDLYVVVYIPAKLVPILVGGDGTNDVFMWFDARNNPKKSPKQLGLSEIKLETPFTPFRSPLDFQQQLFGLMKKPIEDKEGKASWVGSHSLYIAAGLFKDKLQSFGEVFNPADIPVCIDLTDTHVVIMNEIELHVTD
ncbi:MAG: hypothetical protein DRR16_07990 [Candidatus Parabeggiatoa sp. nov. 3]|nr:MAG: hypothetical protein DRR00_00915 [Gammaproteobacteria bacterium]RKZ68320.1 MAG: hypothetical protein DRQ99_04090 [Gammaproteobacteria bacterium]RKZ87132.1 MAG: hypothetical protein DRR16_07990 [Gammaproteobacteria bacterium]HEW97292.1 PKD domain-containing protein [Beggiatoa sp.]